MTNSDITREDKVYAAGLFEGEGCISAVNRTLAVVVAMTDYEPIRWLHSKWGGSCFERKSKRTEHKDCLIWQMVSATGRTFLEDIQPFVKSARRSKQIQLALELIKLISFTGPTGHSDEVWLHRAVLSEKISHSNARGPVIDSNFGKN